VGFVNSPKEMFINRFTKEIIMSFKNLFLFLILFISLIFAIGCAPQQQKPETPSIEKTSPSEIKQTKDDFGCWPPSCSVIPDTQGKQTCEDWKAGKQVQWQDCSYFSGQPACIKLCESEKKETGISSVPAEQPKQQEVAEQQSQSSPPCDAAPLQRQFSNAPYYTGQLIDNHFHMPQMREISNNPDAPVLDKDVSKHDVICLFDKERIKNAFAFYGIPSDIRTQSVQKIQEIEAQYPGVIMHFLEQVSFPGYSVVPTDRNETLNANKGLFKGYGEISLYLDFYRSVQPNDPEMRELYQIADKNNLIVMIHPVDGQAQAMEEILRDYPNVQFLFHGAETLSSADMYFDTFLGKYPNAYYSVDTTLFGDDRGRPILDCCQNKQDFITQFKQKWQDTLNKKVSFWKSKIEKHPDQFLWGTDRGHYAWHYDQDVAALLEEYSRAFIGQLDPSVQEKYAYKNAEDLLQKR